MDWWLVFLLRYDLLQIEQPVVVSGFESVKSVLLILVAISA